MMNFYPGYGYGMGWGAWGVLGGLLEFVFWIIVIILAIRLIRHFMRHDGGRFMHHRGALDILKERYAKGEINKAEYEEKKRDLEA